MLESLFNNTSGNIDLLSILICSITSIILGIIIAVTHMKTSKYSKDFLITITILPLLVEAVMIMVNGNLGTSVAIMGAFSLVRFRSIPGTSKEILSVFFAMSIGLATGMGHIFFPIIITILVSSSIFLFSKTKFYNKDKTKKILKITVPEDLDYDKIFDEVFEKYTKEVELLQTKTVNMGSLYNLTYKVTLNNNISEKSFIDDLRIKNSNLKIVLSQQLQENEM